MTRRTNITILLAEDNPTDRMHVKMALEQHCADCDLRMVVDGVELLEYLYHEGNYQDPQNAPRPDLILLNVDMPRKDGLEALSEIKANPELRAIPVVILTRSAQEISRAHSYDLGATSLINKPLSLEEFRHTIASLSDYWMDIVKLPPKAPPY